MAENEKTLKRVPKLARFDLIPPEVMKKLAEHYGRCIVKYPANNWRKGTEWGVHYAALQRHLAAYWAGEDYDDDPTWAEAGVDNPLHLIAAMWNVVALIEAFEAHPERDDRFPVNNSRQGYAVETSLVDEHIRIEQEETNPACIVRCNLCGKHVEIPRHFTSDLRKTLIESWLGNHECRTTSETSDRVQMNQFRQIASAGDEEFGVYQCNLCGDYSPKLSVDAEGIRIGLKWMQTHKCRMDTTNSVKQTNTFSRLKDDRVFAVMCDDCKDLSPQHSYDESGQAKIQAWKDNHYCKSAHFRI